MTTFRQATWAPDGRPRRDEAVRAARRAGTDRRQFIVGLLDVAGIRESAAELRAAFDAVVAPGTPVLHAFAVKATPLVPVLRLLREEGIGAEVASPGELALARAAGLGPEMTVLDSPAKTPAELREALELGIAVNADNPQELDRHGQPSSARRRPVPPSGSG
ncbi:diaminopimelate decarboxylase [Streptomyces purpurascens]